MTKRSLAHYLTFFSIKNLPRSVFSYKNYFRCWTTHTRTLYSDFEMHTLEEKYNKQITSIALFSIEIGYSLSYFISLLFAQFHTLHIYVFIVCLTKIDTQFLCFFVCAKSVWIRFPSMFVCVWVCVGIYHVVFVHLRCMFTYLIETNTILFDYCAKNGNHIFCPCVRWGLTTNLSQANERFATSMFSDVVYRFWQFFEWHSSLDPLCS